MITLREQVNHFFGIVSTIDREANSKQNFLRCVTRIVLIIVYCNPHYFILSFISFTHTQKLQFLFDNVQISNAPHLLVPSNHRPWTRLPQDTTLS